MDTLRTYQVVDQSSFYNYRRLYDIRIHIIFLSYEISNKNNNLGRIFPNPEAKGYIATISFVNNY